MNRFSLKLSPPVLWFILMIAPIPFFMIFFHFLLSMQKFNDLEEEMARILTKSSELQEVQQKENLLLASLKNPDPHYLEKNVESLIFLLPEMKKIETIQSESMQDENLGKRIHFLKEGGNRLVFSEEQIRTNEIFRELEEKQQHPVEMNEEDLKKLLCLIEGITIWPYGPKERRPQLIIKDFKLSKKDLPSQEKVYVIAMQLIKREYLESSL